MKKAFYLKLRLTFFLLLPALFSSPPFSFAAQTFSAEEKCYQRDWLKRAAYIRNYIQAFKEYGQTMKLSAEQLEKLDDILKACTRTCIKINEDIDIVSKDLEKMLLEINGESDKKIIIEKIKELYSLKAKVELAHFQLLGKAEQLLTDNQKAELKIHPFPIFPGLTTDACLTANCPVLFH